MNHNVATVASWVFLDLCIIIIAARILGRVAEKLRQPPVIGEIVAGIALGPSLLGALPHHVDQALFPADVVMHLNILAQLGLTLFMFMVGLEINVELLRGHQSTFAVISLASIIVPFGLGALLALVFYPSHHAVAGHEVPKLAMVLFLGVAMSITAFPVLARVLFDRRIQGTAIGAIALASAAMNDVVAWTLLAFVIAVTKGGSPLVILRIVSLAAVFAVVMYTIGRRQAQRLESWYNHTGQLTPDMLAVILLGALISAWITGRIGIHPIFGAFIFGMILPHEDRISREILSRLEHVSLLLLLPIFFVVTGFGVNIERLSASGWAQLALVVVVASAGKFISAYIAARCRQLARRHSLVIGVLMNIRGLTELVILSVGKELEILDGEMFSMMVLMALITTAIAGPLLDIIYPAKDMLGDTESPRHGTGEE